MNFGQESTRDREGKDTAGDVSMLADPTRALIAIGAAAALNCNVCLRSLVPAALKEGILEEEVSAAVCVAMEIRTQASGLTDDLVLGLIQCGLETLNSEDPTAGCCRPSTASQFGQTSEDGTKPQVPQGDR